MLVEDIVNVWYTIRFMPDYIGKMNNSDVEMAAPLYTFLVPGYITYKLIFF